MALASLSESLFDALQTFDETVVPYGLYAAGDLAGDEPHRGRKGFTEQKLFAWKMRREHPEWEGALKPFLERHGFLAGDPMRAWNVWGLEGLGCVRLELKRVSKIKVRQYGSRFYVDAQESFDARWDELRMDKALGALWKSEPLWNQPEPDVRLLLLLGFDKAQRPFERELRELKAHGTGAMHGIEFFERTWDDSQGRGFKVKAALWAHRLE